MDTVVFKLWHQPDVHKIWSALEPKEGKSQKDGVVSYGFENKGEIKLGVSAATVKVKLSNGEPAIASVYCHLSHFDSWAEFQRLWHQKLEMGPKWMERTELRRVDLAIDLGLDPEYLALAATAPRLRRCLVIKSKGLTVCLGRPPRQFEIYRAPKDKLRYCDYPLGHAPIKDTVRIEVRHYPPRLPVHKLSELPRVQNLNPFSELRFFELSQSVLTGAKGRTRVNIAAFRYFQQQIGVKGALQLLKSSRSALRDLNKHLTELPNDFVGIAWKNRRNRFFGLVKGDQNED